MLLHAFKMLQLSRGGILLNFMHSFQREKNAAAATGNRRTFLLVAQPAKYEKMSDTQGETPHSKQLTEYSTNTSRKRQFSERRRQ
jgi:hypothetical protein